MFFIDLNHMYVKVSNGGDIWTHDLDEIEFMVPDASLAHVRRGREIAVMPLSVVHQWLWPFGPFDAHDDAFPTEHVTEVRNRRSPVRTPSIVRKVDSVNIPF